MGQWTKRLGTQRWVCLPRWQRVGQRVALALVAVASLAAAAMAQEPPPAPAPIADPPRADALRGDALRVRVEPLADEDAVDRRPRLSPLEAAVNRSLESLGLAVEPRTSGLAGDGALRQFGYGLFEPRAGDFRSLAPRPVPPNYVLGPGDEVVIQLYGQANERYEVAIGRDGRVLLPDLGPVSLAGLTFDEARSLLQARFSEKILGVRAAITLGELRTIQVLVVGEVAQPGTHTLGGLAGMLDALAAAGPILRSGSLRRIHLRRHHETIASFDVYRVLTLGDTGADRIVRHGDTLVVPPIGPTVSVAGAVVRPAIFELRSEGTVGHLLELAGGVLPTAALADAQIERIKDDQRSIIDLDLTLSQARSVSVRSGDVIRVPALPRHLDDLVVISGPVRRPGAVAFSPGLRVSDVFAESRGFLVNADRRFALLRREVGAGQRIEVSYLDLGAALAHPRHGADRVLAPRDELRLFDLSRGRAAQTEDLVSALQTQAIPDIYPPMVVSVAGAVRFPGTLPLAWGARVVDVVAAAGGPQPNADRRYGLIVRQRAPGDRVSFLSFDLAKAQGDPGAVDNLHVFPRDRLVLFAAEGARAPLIADDLARLEQQTPYGERARLVSIDGPVAAPGRYPLEPGMRVTDLIRAAGGLRESGYGLGAELTRDRLGIAEDRNVTHTPVVLARALRGESAADPVLRPHDHLVLHRKPSWDARGVASIRGEVRFPGQYPIGTDATLCGLVRRAGGLTHRAYAFGAVFTRERVRARQQAALDRMQQTFDDLLVQINLSPSKNNNEKVPPPAEKDALLRAIRSLERIPASGRVVIDLERALTCDPAADVALESGDTLTVPGYTPEVTVTGEVYFPTSHRYREALTASDYVRLSGGVTTLGRARHAYVIQANGEVLTVRDGDWEAPARDATVTPGALIFVPLDLDRINPRESAQAWTEVAFRLLTSAASLRFLFGL